MITPTLTFKANTINYLCTVCVTDNNGAKIAFIFSSFGYSKFGLEKIFRQ